MTREFNISPKLRLQDVFILRVHPITGEAVMPVVSRKVSWWIKNDPKLLWLSVHRPKSTTWLVRNAHEELKKKIKLLFPALYAENEKRRNIRRAQKNVAKYRTIVRSGRFNGKPINLQRSMRIWKKCPRRKK